VSVKKCQQISSAGSSVSSCGRSRGHAILNGLGVEVNAKVVAIVKCSRPRAYAGKILQLLCKPLALSPDIAAHDEGMGLGVDSFNKEKSPLPWERAVSH